MKALFLAVLLLLLAPVINADPCPNTFTVQVAQGTAHAAPIDGWQTVTLPDYWKQRWPDYNGSAWYRVQWQGQCDDLALMLDFLVMAGEVFLNGERLWRNQHLQEPLSRSWNSAHYWQLPLGLLQENNELHIHVVGYAINNAGLGNITLGNANALQQKFNKSQWENRTLLFINQVVSAVLACLALMVWLGWRKEQAFFWFAFSTLCWLGFTYFLAATETAPFHNDLQMLRFSTLAYLLFQASFCRFTWSLVGVQHPRLVYGLTAFTAVAVLLILTSASYQHLFDIGNLGSLIIVANALYLFVRSLRAKASKEERWLVFGLLVLFAAGIHDLLHLLVLIDANQHYSMYSCIGFLLLIAVLLGLRVAENARRIERFNHELTLAISDAKTQLSETLQSEHQLALNNAQLQERLHLAHDLHDSLGGQIVRSIIEAERLAPFNEQQKFLATLKLLRNDLRQIIDSSVSRTTLTPHTPVAWLAPLRYRFDGLADEIGINIQWHLPETWHTQPTAQQCLLLARVVEEALTNMFKHSRATEVNLHLTQTENDTLQLTIEDNGKGFDVEKITQNGLGVGLESMNARMKRMNGTLDIRSRTGHTCLTAWLPLNPHTTE